MPTQKLALAEIQTRDDLQPRIQMNMFVVTDYAEAMREGRTFPPVEVVWDGSSYWLWDGFHRRRAAEQAGLTEIDAHVTEGTLEDAQWLALSANRTHGMRRGNEDKRRGVKLALRHPNGINLSDNQIAEHCGVSQPFVGKIRAEIFPTYNDYKSRSGADGRIYDVSNIGHHNGHTRPSPTERLNPQALDLLRFEPVAEDRHQLERIARLPESQQIEVARYLASGETESVVSALKELNRESIPTLIPQAYEVDGCHVVIGDAKEMDLSRFPHKYKVIVADPPWDYDITIKQGTTEGQYLSMTDQDLFDMPVSELAHDDCVLFLWGTWPKLPQAMALVKAWGFKHITGLPWIKTTSNGHLDYGVGYWVRGVSEYFLIARRGNVSVEPLRLRGYAGLLWENYGHSRKPNNIYQLAEALEGPYLELFARRPKFNWTVFGNDPALAQKVFA